MAGEIHEFELGLDNYVKKLGVSADVAVRNFVMRVFGNIIRLTPVDTGWAWNNWYPSINQIVDVKPGPNPTKESRTFPAADPGPVVAQGKAGDIFWLQNGVPYILALEHGHSMQAPAGMVAVSFANAEAFAAEYVKDK